jgi:type III secretion system low calcium response chaperone LcrH/SycD
MSNENVADWLVANAGAITERLTEGATMGQLKGIDKRQLEAVYTVGMHHYEAARYKDARLAFAFCVQNDHLERRYYSALAASFKMLGQPAEALKYYTISSALNIKDPFPTFYTAECLIALGLVAEAQEALEIVIRQSKGNAKYDLLLERATAMLDTIVKRMNSKE